MNYTKNQQADFFFFLLINSVNSLPFNFHGFALDGFVRLLYFKTFDSNRNWYKR